MTFAWRWSLRDRIGELFVATFGEASLEALVDSEGLTPLLMVINEVGPGEGQDAKAALPEASAPRALPPPAST